MTNVRVNAVLVDEVALNDSTESEEQHWNCWKWLTTQAQNKGKSTGTLDRTVDVNLIKCPIRHLRPRDSVLMILFLCDWPISVCAKQTMAQLRREYTDKNSEERRLVRTAFFVLLFSFVTSDN